MEFPVNTNVHINLRSSHVIHGFYVHAFNFSRYALPGVLNQFTIRARAPARTSGSAPSSCGLYHSLMCQGQGRLPVPVPRVAPNLQQPNGRSGAKAAATATKQQLSTAGAVQADL